MHNFAVIDETPGSKTPTVIATVLAGRKRAAPKCEMEFIPENQALTTQALVLEPRSALLIGGEARHDWLHTIRARLSNRGHRRTRRVSLTFRNMILDEGNGKHRNLAKRSDVTES